MTMPPDTTHLPTHRGQPPINDVSAWVLRVGVALSVTVMLAGIAVSALHNNISVHRMETARFDPDPRTIWRGIVTLHGQSIIEAGIYLLVLTPVTRVFMSVILFAFFEKDRLYAAMTLLVLLLTIVGLLCL